MSTNPEPKQPLARRIEIFRPGTFSPMTGGEVSFSETDVRAIADSYDPALFQAPIVVGHPKHDDPAYGWVSGLDFADGRLVADLDDVDPAFADAVQDGRFKKVSASFYGPGSKQNPVPGTYYLKHVGFLGAAAPAVKGLKPVTEAAFADGEGDVVIELGEPGDAFVLRALADVLGRLRDFLINDKGQDEADKIIPRFEVTWLQEQAANAAAQERVAADNAFAENTGTAAQEDKEELMDTEELTKKEARLAARERDLRAKEDLAFVDGLATEGKPLVGELRGKVLSFMAQLDDDAELSFGEGDKAVKSTSRAAFLDLLKSLPKVLNFGEMDKGDDPLSGPLSGNVSFVSPDDAPVDQQGLALHGLAVAFQAQNPGTDYLTAIKAVGGK